MRRIAAEVAVLVLAGTAPLVAQYFGQNKVQYRTFDFRSEEHTSELQSQSNLVCRLLLEKKKNQPAERRFRVTRRILEVLAEHPGLNVTIITKSPLITRHIHLLSRINRVSDLSDYIPLLT